jgi:hypothetical protein
MLQWDVNLEPNQECASEKDGDLYDECGAPVEYRFGSVLGSCNV